jgi:hypothetical protein
MKKETENILKLKNVTIETEPNWDIQKWHQY